MRLVALILLLSLPAPSAGDRSFCTDANGTYKPNSTYRSNLLSLADELIARATKSYSPTGMSGGTTNSDKVYGAVLCRGDSAGADCGRLLREAFESTINADSAAVCALHRDVALYSELYQLRFSDEDSLSTFSNAAEWVDGTNLNLVPDAETGQFNEVVAKLTRKLAEAAAWQPDRYKTADAPWPSRERERKVFGLPDRCSACLDGIAVEIRRKIGSGKMGGAIHGARCTLRYETDTQFFATTGSSNKKTRRTVKTRSSGIQK